MQRCGPSPRRDGQFLAAAATTIALSVLAIRGHTSLLERLLGAGLTAAALIDIFLTVLYARLGTGIISDHVASLTWRLFLVASSRFGAARGRVLSFCGPVVVVLLLIAWAFVLTVGSAMILHPSLGVSLYASAGATSRDFSTAMYASGNSLAVVGSAGFVPETMGMRLLYLFNSLAGMSGLSLALTYLMQIYSALQRRNILGRTVHLLTCETGDAAELVAALGPEGRFEAGMADLTSLASDLTAVGESQHFYPVLVYFRFRDPLYAVSRFALVALDAVALIRSALDPRRSEWLMRSASIEQLQRASLLLVTTIEDTFLRTTPECRAEPFAASTLEGWRLRYAAALVRLRRAGISTHPDEQVGAATYLALRARWQRHVEVLAPSLAYSMNDIDPASQKPEPMTA